ncbi:twin-arginine translocation pathway signal [Mycolicibacterium neworleansense]|uniref:Membrane protein n=1 Tax=Mycolicibacterium neworleansense TaxID=146018 RepID=A0A0H5RQM2_9MYCO|nr:twin-arginine translocation pathway signal [Mycolicibacterium neworleansense]MCV7365750.1 twin-arginine translocation pathway signal [Mycolicibacterium neworleansense]CRZ16450.1 membrane protein [Mycolicibacterium neworleansense]
MSTTTAEVDAAITSEGESVPDEPNTNEANDSERQGQRTHRIARRWRPIAVVCLVLASASAAAALYFGVYRADQGNAVASTAVVDAATEGSLALLSYAPNSLDQDIAGARSHLTGDFLDYYSEFANKFVVPAAKQKDIHATASVVRAAPVEVQSDTAKVLVFLNQATTSRDNPEPAQAASAVKVGLTKIDGKWLISSFDPI